MEKRSGVLLTIVGVCAAAGAEARAAAEPDNPYPYGKAEFQGKEIQDVVKLLRTADRYRDLCVSQFDKGSSQSVVEHYGREAKNWYREALEREPGNAYASLCVGYVDLTLGRAAHNPTAKENHFSVATSRFREALEKRPGYARAYLFMAQVQALSGEYGKAEKNLRLILNSDIEDSQVHSWLAYVLLKIERKSEAKKHVARAIELDDPSSSAKWSREHQ